MELTFRKQGTEVTFRLRGSIMQPDALKLREAVAKAMELSAGDMDALKVDLRDFGEVDDDALDVLAEWHTECRRGGVALRLVGVPPELRERFRERGIFDFDDDSPIIV